MSVDDVIYQTIGAISLFAPYNRHYKNLTVNECYKLCWEYSQHCYNPSFKQLLSFCIKYTKGLKKKLVIVDELPPIIYQVLGKYALYYFDFNYQHPPALIIVKELSKLINRCQNFDYIYKTICAKFPPVCLFNKDMYSEFIRIISTYMYHHYTSKMCDSQEDRIEFDAFTKVIKPYYIYPQSRDTRDIQELLYDFLKTQTLRELA
jgi:hypothetical protein